MASVEIMRRDCSVAQLRAEAARTRAGDEALRAVLVVGATSVIQHVQTRRKAVALAYRTPQTQVAEVGRCGAGQQDGPRRLEADGHGRQLLREIRARRSGERSLEISQTRGATQLQPC